MEAAEGAGEEGDDLRLRAGDQLLRCGDLQGGLRTLEPVASAVGVNLAPAPAGALASLVYHRARLRLRGLAYREKKVSDVRPDALRRIDLCWSLANGVTPVDPVRGGSFLARH